jgi:endoglycosylceramidase
LAREFKDDDNVIAFELMNEPNFTWSIYIYPGLTDSHFLQEFYDAVVERIHQEDPSRVILFEPTTWSNQYTDFVITKEMFKSRLSHPPGGLEYSNRSVLAFHYYPWVNKLFNSTNPRSYFDSRVEDMHHLGVGGFVTEFSSAGSGDAVVHGMNMDIMDELLLSSM